MKILKFIAVLSFFLSFQNLLAEEKNSKIYEGKWVINCSSDSEKNEKNVLLKGVFLLIKK